jgi:pimeloyl-ACP methyl ester carboxylesterase
MRTIKLTAGLIALLVVVYLTTCSILWARQRHFIFMPQRTIGSTPADYALGYEEVFFPVQARNGRQEKVHAWWIPAPSGPGRTLLYLHGSALNIAANIEHSRRFQRLGFSVLLLSYRGYGRSDGEFPSEGSVYADARAAWNYLVNHRGIPPARLFIYGHSLGGAVGIQLAIEHPEAAGLIVEGTFTSIKDVAAREPLYRMLPLEIIINQRFDSIAKIDRLQTPVLFIHGTEDQSIPSWMSQRLYENAPFPKTLKLVMGGGHNSSARVGGRHYLQAVRSFVESQLP